MILALDSVLWTEYHFDTVWGHMHPNARRAHFRLARADDCGAQKSKGKGKQVLKDTEEGAYLESHRIVACTCQALLITCHIIDEA